jgi:hypothetical protein
MSSLAVHRWAMSFEVPSSAGTQAVAELSRDLSKSLREHLRSRWPFDDGSNSDGPVLLIRRLKLELQHSTAATVDELAETLVEAIACGVQKARASGTGGVFFPDRAAFNAAYIAARLDGNAHSRWWFRSFNGLTALSQSAMLRTLLQRDPAIAWQTLVACAPAVRTRLWLQLSGDNAAQILRDLEPQSPAESDGPPDGGAWERVAGHLIAFVLQGLPPPVAILATVVELAANADGDAARTSLALAGPLAPIMGLITDDARNIPAVDSQMDRHADHWTVRARVRGMPAGLIAALSAAMNSQASSDARPAISSWRHSSLAGYALLLPLIDSDLPQFVNDWPAVESCLPASAMLCLLVLAACEDDNGLWRDSVWRDAVGVSGSVSAADIARWVEIVGPDEWSRLASLFSDSEAVDASHASLPAELIPREGAQTAFAAWAQSLMRRFASSLPGFAEASPAFLRANLMGAGGVAQCLPDRMHFRLNRPPLDILLGMTGLADRHCLLSDGRTLILERQK